jgi:type II secretion system protein J
MSSRKHPSQSAFTLLEVVITIAILAGMILIITQVLKASIDMRQSLGQKNAVTGRLNRALLQLNQDLTHVFLVDHRMPGRTDKVSKRTIFKIEKSNSADSVAFTYSGHRIRRENAAESNFSYVVYELQPSKTFPGRTHLYRGEFPRVPATFKEKPPMEIFAEFIKSITIEAWDGDKWKKDGWDSTRGDTNNRLPQMLRITLTAWNQDSVEGGSAEDAQDSNVSQYSTVVYLPAALNFMEIKQRVSSFSLKAIEQ